MITGVQVLGSRIHLKNNNSIAVSKRGKNLCLANWGHRKFVNMTVPSKTGLIGALIQKRNIRRYNN